MTTSDKTPPEPRPGDQLDRRGFLRTSAAAAAAAALVHPRATSRAETPPVRPAAPARNLILLVADGMSTGSLALADLFIRQRENRASHWLTMMSLPAARSALVDTAAADGPVTDSAASASAWSIGEPCNVGSISITPDGRAPAPLFLRARRRGMAVGVATTAPVTDATPAAFLANVASRAEEVEIARQCLDRGFDCLLGGGADRFTDDLLAAHPAVSVVRSRDALLAAPTAPGATPLLGLFSTRKLLSILDRPPAEPTLSEMTAVLLRRLAPSPNGFVALIESEAIDEAAHANDAAGLVHDMAAFDDALKLALDFTLARTDTLLIVTTDHANANPGLATLGDRGMRQFDRLQSVTHSFDWILARLAAAPAPSRTGALISNLVREGLGLTLSPDEIGVLDQWLGRNRVDPYDRRNKTSAPLGSILSNHFGVAFTGPDHTSDPVIATAIGPGADRLGPLMRIHDLHAVMAGALDLVEPPAPR